MSLERKLGEGKESGGVLSSVEIILDCSVQMSVDRRGEPLQLCSGSGARERF